MYMQQGYLTYPRSASRRLPETIGLLCLQREFYFEALDFFLLAKTFRTGRISTLRDPGLQERRIVSELEILTLPQWQ